MEQLPYIDEHSVEVEADPAEAWSALVSVLRSGPTGKPPAALTKAMCLEPAKRRMSTPGELEQGDSVPGFRVREIREGEHLGLAGRHRFSRYELVFEVDRLNGGSGSRIRARTYAEFPGVLGRAYRALVIDSRAHRVIVRRLLARIAGRA